MEMMPFYIDMLNNFFVVNVIVVDIVNIFNHFINLVLPDDFFNKILTSTIQLLAVVEPFGIIPILINLTKKMEKETSKALSKSAALTSALLLMIFGIAGTQILAAFGITVNSLYGSRRSFVIYSIIRNNETWCIKEC